MAALGPPSVADLLDQHRAQLHVDAKWFQASTLRSMRRDLLEHCASLAKRGDMGAYDKATTAAAAIQFVLSLLEHRRAYQETGK
jgi:hypothetical protein